MNTLKPRTLALSIAMLVVTALVTPVAAGASIQVDMTIGAQAITLLQPIGHGQPDPGTSIACDGCSGNGGGPS